MLIGDMAIKDLSPRDANSSGRIIKNMRICGSGLYEYGVSEAALMGLTIPGDYKDPTFFIYRSPEVLNENKDLYARVPIITGHHVRVTTANAKQLAVGMVGDTIQSEVGEDGETYLYTTGTIITGDGIEAYERLGELSVGYDPIVKWQPGVHKGHPYQAVLVGFNEINHLLICKTARGGHQCMIMDEKPWGFDILNGGKSMGIFAKIFGTNKPMAGDAQVVSALLQSISAGADPEVQVTKVRDLLGDCKDDTFVSYLDELAGARKAGADADTLKRAVDIVDNYYCSKLAGDAKECGDKEPKPENGDKEVIVDHEKDGNKRVTVEKDGEKKEVTVDHEKDGDKKVTVKEHGDAQPEIDYDRIINGVVAALKPQAQNGDEGPNAAALQELTQAMGGDAKTEISSDELLKQMF